MALPPSLYTSLAMAERRQPLTSPPSQRDPSSRHSMFVQRQDPQDLRFVDAIRGREAFFSSLYGGGSVDHLATAPAGGSTLNSDARPLSQISLFTPKPPTSAVWRPLFQHSTLLASATPLLATLKRDTHVQTEVEIRKNVGVQTEAVEVTPAAHTRDVLVQTGEEWAKASAVTNLLQPANGESGRDHQPGCITEADTTPVSNTCAALNGYFARPNENVLGNCEGIPKNLENGTQPVIPQTLDPFSVADEKHPTTHDLPTEFLEDSVINSKQELRHLNRWKPNADITINSDQPKGKSANLEGKPTLEEESGHLIDISHSVDSDLQNSFNFQDLGHHSKIQDLPGSLGDSQKCSEFRNSCESFGTYKYHKFLAEAKENPRPKSNCLDYMNDAQLKTESPRKTASRNSAHSQNMDMYYLEEGSSTSASEKGSVSSVLDAFYKDSFVFESCENLDQLEEEIIRNLYTPINNLEESDSRDFEANYVKPRKDFVHELRADISSPDGPSKDEILGEQMNAKSAFKDSKNCFDKSDENISVNVPDNGSLNGNPETLSTEGHRILNALPESQCQATADTLGEILQGVDSGDGGSTPEERGKNNAITIKQRPPFRRLEFHEELYGRDASNYDLDCQTLLSQQAIFNEESSRNFGKSMKTEDGTVTPSKIDMAGMLFRGEMIEMLMRGERISPTPPNNSPRERLTPTQCSDKEIAVEVLPSPSNGLHGNLEVRRSSWSASGSRGSYPEKLKQEDLEREGICSENFDSFAISPESEESGSSEPNLSSNHTADQADPTTSESLPPRDQEVASPYWPIQKTNEVPTIVKRELQININSSRKCASPPIEMESSEFVKEPENVLSALSPPPPPPPPPPPSSTASRGCISSQPGSYVAMQTSQLENAIRDQKLKSASPLPKIEHDNHSSTSSPKSLMMQELIERFQRRHKNDGAVPETKQELDKEISRDKFVSIFGGTTQPSQVMDALAEQLLNIANVSPGSVNKTDSYPVSSPVSQPELKTSRERLVWSPSNTEEPYGSKIDSPQECSHKTQVPSGRQQELDLKKGDVKIFPNFNGTTIITDEAPPSGAVLVDEKVTVEGGEIHTDKYYAVPVKEVLKEKTSTTKFIPAPPKFEGIGPTEDGIPTSLRHSVKKENMSNWYKTMFKSLHKAGQPHYGGYSSDPEFDREEKVIISKSATLSNRKHPESNVARNHNLKQGYPPSAKSTIESYRAYPRPIEDYEPGYSSVADNEKNTGSKRFLPPMNYTKPSYIIKDGYESDTSVLRKLNQPEFPSSEQQKIWYKEIQRGGEIPRFGLGKAAPEKPKEPIIGPPPPPIHDYPKLTAYSQNEVTRPQVLPPEYTNNNEMNSTDLTNGNYAAQMKQAIHAELQHRMSPISSQQLSPNYKVVPKSPPKSPEMKMLARILYDFTAETPRELALTKGEMVLILKQLDKNWYEGLLKGHIGIFPVNYVEILPPEHVSPQMKQSHEGLAKALYNFSAKTSVELPLKKGDTVTLIRMVDENWYEGRIKDRKGIFPVSYVQIVQEPTESCKSPPSSKHLSGFNKISTNEEDLRFSPANYGPTRSPQATSPKTPLNSGNQLQNNIQGCRTKKGCSLPEPILYRAIYGYYPQNADELELLDGDTVYVVEMCDDGWYVGTSVRTGVFGIFPGNYVEKV